jgi:hypothetical protein
MTPRLHALLAWFDEDCDALIRAVESIAPIADHIIAIDGPYETFPHTAVASHQIQAQVIRWGCARHATPCTIYQPGIAWRNEGYKRTALFDIAHQYGTAHTDWVLPIDADEELVNGEQLRAYIDTAPADHTCASIYYHTPTQDMDKAEQAITQAGTETRSYAQPRLMRLLPGLRVRQPTHYIFDHDGGTISTPSHEFAYPDGPYFLHHTMTRPLERKQAKAAHIEARNRRGEQ